MITRASKKLCTFRLAAFGVMGGGLSHAGADDPKCNNGTLNGSYGFTLTGWRIPTPDTNIRSARAGLGRIASDGHGNPRGAEPKSHDVLIIPLTFTGTNQFYTDCTGTAHLVTTEA